MNFTPGYHNLHCTSTSFWCIVILKKTRYYIVHWTSTIRWVTASDFTSNIKVSVLDAMNFDTKNSPSPQRIFARWTGWTRIKPFSKPELSYRSCNIYSLFIFFRLLFVWLPLALPNRCFVRSFARLSTRSIRFEFKVQTFNYY